MSYYPTIEEDLARAKEILQKGRVEPGAASIFDENVRERVIDVMSGTIYGADIYAAYKLLESFVEFIEGHREDHHVAAENPFDHNAECTYCDEQGMHRADCPWLTELVRENGRLRAEVANKKGEPVEAPLDPNSDPRR